MQPVATENKVFLKLNPNTEVTNGMTVPDLV